MEVSYSLLDVEASKVTRPKSITRRCQGDQPSPLEQGLSAINHSAVPLHGNFVTSTLNLDVKVIGYKSFAIDLKGPLNCMKNPTYAYFLLYKKNTTPKTQIATTAPTAIPAIVAVLEPLSFC